MSRILRNSVFVALLASIALGGLVASRWPRRATAQELAVPVETVSAPVYDSSRIEGHVKCVDCHYSPGEKHSVRVKFKGLAQLFTYFYSADKTVRNPALIDDLSCLASTCHPAQKLNEKQYEFGEKIFYIHKTHFDKSIEGQAIHCDVCHQHLSVDKHFEVSINACFLCHFKNEGFNEGRGK